jgi:AcrR family transcriptional regulator
MANTVNHSGTREHILGAALKSFADRGYAATSVQQIVDAAQVSKPALYYYFKDKAGLFQALVDQAHDERYRLMQKAADRGKTVAEKLEEIVAAVFEFSEGNRELMRLAFATAFAATGEAPGGTKCREKGRRNFEFVRSLIECGQALGELNMRFSADELAMGIYGQLNSYVMVRLLVPDCPLNRQTARQMVQLFLEGAGARKMVASRGPKKAARNGSAESTLRHRNFESNHGVKRHKRRAPIRQTDGFSRTRMPPPTDS